jgi:hypothetical protein
MRAMFRVKFSSVPVMPYAVLQPKHLSLDIVEALPRVKAHTFNF